jgi:hypothetical protein
MAKAISTKTSVVVSMGVLLTISAMLVAAPSAYAESTCIGACKTRGDTTIDNSQDNSVDSHDTNNIDNSVDNSVDSQTTNNIDNNIDNSVTNDQDVTNDNDVCTAPGGNAAPGGGQQGGGSGGAGGCNNLSGQ